MPTEADAIAATRSPATVDSLAHDLCDLGLSSSDVVIVHASLSALGWIAGGAQAVVEALLSTVGTTGTVVMPTQSGQLSDPADWQDPPVPAEWIETIRNGLPAYDPDLTPTRSMGQIVECFRGDPRTLRSPHPLVSFAALGPKAASIVGSHPLTPQFGETSPLARLDELDALVLLLGVDHGSNTALHLAEYRAAWDGKTTASSGAPILVDGERRWVNFDDLDIDEGDFASLGEAFAATGLEATGAVGAGTGRLSRLREIVPFAVEWMEDHRPASLGDG